MQLKLAEDMDGAELLKMRSGEKETISNDDLINAVLFQINSGLINHEDYTLAYSRRYKEPFPEEKPEKEEVAPVQPKEKKSHVTVAKPKPKDKPIEKPKPEPKPEPREEVKPESKEEPKPEEPHISSVEKAASEEKTLLDAQLKAADDDGINTLMNKRLKQLNDCIRQIMTKRFSKIAVFEALDSTRELVKILEEVERRKAG